MKQNTYIFKGLVSSNKIYNTKSTTLASEDKRV